jgi:hypothetical protein
MVTDFFGIRRKLTSHREGAPLAEIPTRSASCPASLSQRKEAFNGAAPAESTADASVGRLAFGCRLFWCTADAAKVDKRTRSKWSRLLRYADEHKLNSEPLDQLIKRKGCINVCAASVLSASRAKRGDRGGGIAR